MGDGVDSQKLRRQLLSWYDRHADDRKLPWRVTPAERAAGHSPEPYHILVSEVMLQQTTAGAVVEKYHGFLSAFPSVEALAAASEDSVLKAWAGLGYYNRARRLKAAAECIARDGWPTGMAGLQALPGLGVYTAAAVAAIAFDESVVPVDGNVERVIARLFGVETPLPTAKAELNKRAQIFSDQKRPGDMAQALMDLGATICRPKAPSCMVCPVAGFCTARREGLTETLPRKAAKKAKRVMHTVAFVAMDRRGRVLLRRRPETGVLAGLWEVPSTSWREVSAKTTASPAEPPPLRADWQAAGTVRHIFTHIDLSVDVFAAIVSRGAVETPPGGTWLDPEAAGVPRLTEKIIQTARAGLSAAAA